MSNDAPIRDHKAWLGYVQQDGLVVSPTALVDAQVVLDRNTLPMQECFLPFVKEATLTVGQLVKTKIAKLGENITVTRFVRFKVGDSQADSGSGTSYSVAMFSAVLPI